MTADSRQLAKKGPGRPLYSERNTKGLSQERRWSQLEESPRHKQTRTRQIIAFYESLRLTLHDAYVLWRRTLCFFISALRLLCSLLSGFDRSNEANASQSSGYSSLTFLLCLTNEANLVSRNEALPLWKMNVLSHKTFL